MGNCKIHAKIYTLYKDEAVEYKHKEDRKLSVTSYITNYKQDKNLLAEYRKVS